MLRQRVLDVVARAHKSSTSFRGEVEYYVIVTQRKEGDSFWAKCVQEKILKESHIVWVFKNLPGGKKEWKLISLDRGKNKRLIIFLPRDRNLLRKVELQMKRYVAKTRTCTHDIRVHVDPLTGDMTRCCLECKKEVGS